MMLSILPRICLICQIHYQGKFALCCHCQSQLRLATEYCQSCGQSGNQSCPKCRAHGSVIHQFFTVFAYEGPIQNLIQQYKFEPRKDLLSFFGHAILKHLPPNLHHTECLIPVPLHPRRLSHRGFHHTALLCQFLSKQLKIPWSMSYCSKRKNTKAQAWLNKAERQHNLIQAFSVQPPPYKHITLIDDVATTGQTLNQLARGFEALGINTIDAWVIAKA